MSDIIIEIPIDAGATEKSNTIKILIKDKKCKPATEN
jgi:hypothetical protein